jgi:hypothetical protein
MLSRILSSWQMLKGALRLRVELCGLRANLPRSKYLPDEYIFFVLDSKLQIALNLRGLYYY